MDDFFALAEKGIGELENGLEEAARYVDQLVSVEKDSGMGLCKLLHGLNDGWVKSGVDKEEWDSYREWATTRFCLAERTLHKKLCTWEFLQVYVPSHFTDTFLKNWNLSMYDVGYKVAVKHRYNKHTGNYDFMESGYEIEPSDWLALSECIDVPMVHEVKGKIDGKEPNANRVNFGFDANNGAIRFYLGKKEERTIGYFMVDEEDAVIQDGITEALERLRAQ